MDHANNEDSSSMQYKVMLNKRIVDKLQMSMNSAGCNEHAVENGESATAQQTICFSHQEELDKLRDENKLLEQKYKETFEALDKVRQTALEASERALSREFRIAFLEKALHGCEVSLGEANNQLKEHDKRYNQGRKDMQKELGVIQSQVDHLNSLVRDKDSRILEMLNENTRLKNQLQDITQRKSDLLKQLKDMCEKLNTVVWETNQREKMLNNLENELKKREMERQNAFLTEVTRSKRLLVNIKVKENMLNQVITSKNHKINDLETQVKQLIDRINRMGAVFYDVTRGMDVSIQSGCQYSGTSDNKLVECDLKSPCSMNLLSGRARVLI